LKASTRDVISSVIGIKVFHVHMLLTFVFAPMCMVHAFASLHDFACARSLQ
jgi:hypothetical protein